MKHPLVQRLLVLIAVSAVAGSRVESADFEVGFAVADITPPVGWRIAGGFSENVSTGVHDPLQAKAVVVAQDGVKLALVCNDLCSVPRALTDAARARAGKATGIPVENIVITATHTHGGPEYHGPLRDSLHARAKKANDGKDPREPEDYHARLVDTWVKVITQAHQARQPAELSVVVPQRLELAFNRRYYMKDGSVRFNPGVLNPDVFRPVGPTDPDVPYLLVKDGKGKPLGSLAVFAMHTAIFGGTKFGACYPGHLQTALRDHFKAEDFVSLFAEGCAGDVNHIDVTRPWDDKLDYSKRAGTLLARTIADALPHARRIAGGELAMKSVTIHAPVAPLGKDDYLKAKQDMDTFDKKGATVEAWRMMLQHEFWEKHGGKLPQEVQAIRLDKDTAIVTLPHEVFVELGIAVKSGSPFKTTIVISLANDMDFYVPVRRAFEEGSYEPTTCPLLPGCGERLVEAAVKLLNELKP